MLGDSRVTHVHRANAYAQEATKFQLSILGVVCKAELGEKDEFSLSEAGHEGKPRLQEEGLGHKSDDGVIRIPTGLWAHLATQCPLLPHVPMASCVLLKY